MQNGEKTLQEIYDQPGAWNRCLTVLEGADLGTLTEGKDFHTHEWLFIRCGTSYYLAQAAAASLATLTGLPARALPASEVFSSTALVAAGAVGRPSEFSMFISCYRFACSARSSSAGEGGTNANQSSENTRSRSASRSLAATNPSPGSPVS